MKNYKMQRNIRNASRKMIAYTILIFVGALFALPLIWLVLAAFDARALATIAPIHELTLDNFTRVLSEPKYVRGFANSMVYASVTSLVIVFCALFAAYPLSRYNFRAAERISLSMLFLSSLPGTALIVPIYKMFLTLNLLNKPVGFILISAAGGLPYSIWMMKNFLDAVPAELEEAAWVDGANRFSCILKVVVPLMVPGILTVAVFQFIGVWSNFLTPYILLSRKETFTASIFIYTLFGEHNEVNYGVLAAYSMLYMLPVVVLYTLSQNYMSKGFSMAGASKG